MRNPTAERISTRAASGWLRHPFENDTPSMTGTFRQVLSSARPSTCSGAANSVRAMLTTGFAYARMAGRASRASSGASRVSDELSGGKREPLGPRSSTSIMKLPASTFSGVRGKQACTVTSYFWPETSDPLGSGTRAKG